jgi:hypothetical protein
MKPSDIKCFDVCFIEKDRNLKDNNTMPFWKRRRYIVPGGKEVEAKFDFYLEIRELVRLYAAIGNGKRVTKKIGKEKYNLLPSIRKRKETNAAKKAGTYEGPSKNTRKIYNASDFPIPGAEYGGFEMIKDKHKLTQEQWDCGWISDEEGKMTIMDVGQYEIREDGHYDVYGVKKPSRPKRIWEMTVEEVEVFRANEKAEKERVSKEKRKARNRRHYLKRKMCEGKSDEVDKEKGKVLP